MIATSIEARVAFRERIVAAAQRRFEWRPPMPLTNWAERHFKIASSRASTSGNFSLDLVPYLREPMESVSEPEISKIVVQKAARLGFTEAMVNATVGWVIAESPGSIIVAWPTKEDAGEWSKETLNEMLQENEVFVGRITETGERSADSTIFHKRFVGGFLYAIGSNAPRALRRKNAKVAIVDELDACEDATKAGKEGDFVTRLVRRTSTYPDKKIILGSQPGERRVNVKVRDANGDPTAVDIELTRIEREYLNSDQREYYVACPHCTHEQTLQRTNLEWDKEDVSDGPVHRYDTAHFRCVSCGGRIEERHKVRIVKAGRWIARRPGHPVRGYKINAFYSLIGESWADLAMQYHEATRDAEKMKAFTQQVLGEGYEDKAGRPATAELTKRRETYLAEVPMGVGVLTASADVQHDRIEVLVRGWGVGEESWDIYHARLWGNPQEADLWNRLDHILGRPYLHESGASINIARAFVDSGDMSEFVYPFTRARSGRGIWAVKGEGRKPSKPLLWGGKSADGSTRLFHLDVDRCKDVLFRRLSNTVPGPGYIHFPQQQADGLDDEYLLQLGREKKEWRRDRFGRSVARYVNTGRNEAIDLHNYAYGAYRLLGDAVARNLPQLVTQIQQRGRDLGGLAAAQKRIEAAPPAPASTAPPPRPRIRVHSRGVQ